ncbi:hypothetical protein ONS96_002392 [Cadophora gregata f. sp. sojae]|nr:hypothetical protein ONS96_002392 [Cadophora gregata f. sp. sojae]
MPPYLRSHTHLPGPLGPLLQCPCPSSSRLSQALNYELTATSHLVGEFQLAVVPLFLVLSPSRYCRVVR